MVLEGVLNRGADQLGQCVIALDDVIGVDLNVHVRYEWVDGWLRCVDWLIKRQAT